MQVSLRSLGLGIVVGALGMAQVAPVAQAIRVTLTGPVEVAPEPDPGQFVIITAGETFAVPAGKSFVLTALGTNTNSTGGVSFEVDGHEEIRGASVASVPQGMSVEAGATITLSNGGGNERAWGYLVDE